MSRGTPEETFAEARGAMERGDRADTLLQICARHGISEGTLTDLRGRGRAIVESAQLPRVPPGPAMLERSKRHQQLVKAYQQGKKDALDAVADLPAFTAAMERAVRADGSGGSVSARLFVGETLEQVSVEGARAWGTRRLADSAAEDVGFVRRKTVWYIRLFARRR
jgi:hypothetical protein